MQDVSIKIIIPKFWLTNVIAGDIRRFIVFTGSYSASNTEPIIINIPIAAPIIVGQFVPDWGRAASVGVGVGDTVELPEQVQSVSSGQDGFLQRPLTDAPFSVFADVLQ